MPSLSAMMEEDGNDNEEKKTNIGTQQLSSLSTSTDDCGVSIIRIRVAANIARREFSKNSTAGAVLV